MADYFQSYVYISDMENIFNMVSIPGIKRFKICFNFSIPGIITF